MNIVRAASNKLRATNPKMKTGIEAAISGMPIV